MALPITLGADPEFFVVDSNNRIVPAHRVGIPSIKNKAITPDSYAQYFRDGVAVEINPTPANCRESSGFFMRSAVEHLNDLLKPHGFHLSSTPAMNLVLPDDMEDAPEDVRSFGCKPSYCAYEGGREKRVPLDANTHPGRYLAGHLHFSVYRHNNPIKMEAPWVASDEALTLLVRMMDRYVGLPLAFILDSPENRERRKWYGQAGEYRRQAYGPKKSAPDYFGVEYRTPAADTFNSVALLSLALGAGRWVIRNFNTLAASWDEGMEKPIRDAINLGGRALDPQLLGEAPGFYDPELIIEIASKRLFRNFDLLDGYDIIGGSCTKPYNGWLSYFRARHGGMYHKMSLRLNVYA